MNTNPIGVFDSGIGGLSVLRDLRARLPHERWLYIADSGFCPYGGRPDEFVQARAAAITDFLITQGAKAIVIACNTATAAAASWLRERYTLPIIAMEPAIKPAAALTKSGVIGVLATAGTVKSERLLHLIERWGAGVTVLTQPCPGLAERVELGDLDGPEARVLLFSYLDPLLARAADVIVLGCTHYPFLRSLLQERAGPGVTFVDSAAAVARHTEHLLADHDMLASPSLDASPSGSSHTSSIWTSGDPNMVQSVVMQLDGPTPVMPLPAEAMQNPLPSNLPAGNPHNQL